LTERPGKSLKPFDLEKIQLDIEARFGSACETDVASYTQYPKVYEEYRQIVEKYGDLSVLPTRYFLSKPEVGEEFSVQLEKGVVLSCH
jgi:pyruvate carboxylase